METMETPVERHEENLAAVTRAGGDIIMVTAIVPEIEPPNSNYMTEQGSRNGL
jgi:hypothetical protein